MEKKFTIELSEAHLNIVYQALGEIPAKYAIPVMDEIKKQFTAIVEKEEVKEVKE